MEENGRNSSRPTIPYQISTSGTKKMDLTAACLFLTAVCKKSSDSVISFDGA